MRSRFASDRGITLTELMIGISIMMVVGVIFTQTLATSLMVTRDLQGATAQNDSTRLAIQQIDREFRGAERICDPGQGIESAGDRLEFRTRAFAGAAPPTGYEDIVYELRDPDGDGGYTTLQRSDDSGTTWRTVIEGMMNQIVVDEAINTALSRPAGTPGVPVFETLGGTVDATPSQGKVISLRLWVDANQNDRLDPRQESTEVTGRNIWNPNSTSC
jgi:type II secretory pathway pseudopilin PulG